MASREDIRRMALALSDVEEADHHGIPSFRVAGKIFCTIHLDQPWAMLKLDGEDQANLAAGHPDAIEPVPGYWGRKGSTFVWFERLDADLLASLMRHAWSNAAPKRLKPAGP